MKKYFDGNFEKRNLKRHLKRNGGTLQFFNIYENYQQNKLTKKDGGSRQYIWYILLICLVTIINGAK